MKTSKGLLALSPLVLFMLIYLLSSIVAGDFYQVPVSAVFVLCTFYSFFITKGSIKEKIAVFSSGAGNSNILLMIWIFVLAGAFAGTAKDIGAVEATVHATLSVVPASMLYAGLFLTACFISMAVGTSVGTIVALAPIATGLAAECGSSVPFMVAIVVGGAFFGDNLSFISDTTIAATQAAGCEMKDKFRTNIIIIAPAVVVVTLIYLLLGSEVASVPEAQEVNIVKLLPYLLVILLALTGRNVLLILSIGIALNALIGFICGDFTWSGWLVSIGNGIAGMSDLIIVTLLAGGLLAMIRNAGGLEFLMTKLTARVSGRRGAQASMALLVCLANFCTANNTIAIITTGPIVKDISDKFGIAPRKTASILDTFSCLIQGLLPYGAQLLMASSLAGISSSSIIPFLYYPFIMGACAILAIVVDYPKK